MPRERIRILRVIARLNIGGPAYHVSLLSGRLDPERYETLLVAGRPGPGEGSFESLARHYGARLELLPSLSPAIDPRADLRSLRALRSIARGFRPHIVHTHTAKAGALGRAAALTGGRPRPLIVHTYHGHVLEGDFGPAVAPGGRRSGWSCSATGSCGRASSGSPAIAASPRWCRSSVTGTTWCRTSPAPTLPSSPRPTRAPRWL